MKDNHCRTRNLAAGALLALCVVLTALGCAGGESSNTPAVIALAGMSDPSRCADLGALTISSGVLSPGFNPATTAYSVEVPEAVSSLSIIAAAASAAAELRINGSAHSSGASTAELPLNAGRNTFNLVVTAPDGSISKTYTIVVNRVVQSSNADLANLTISGGILSPAFTENRTSYYAEVDAETTRIALTPTAASLAACIRINGVIIASQESREYPLSDGDSVFDVAVTAEKGMVKNYRLVVRRLQEVGNNPDLASLRISTGTLSPLFDPGVTEYRVRVDHEVDWISIIPTAVSASAAIRVNNTPVSSGGGAACGLVAGENILSVVVTAGSGALVRSRVYTVRITRSAVSANADLAGISLSAGALTSLYRPYRFIYYGEVPHECTSLTLTPTAAVSVARILVNGEPVVSGTASSPIPLSRGKNILMVTVIAEDGRISRTTLIELTRPDNPADTARLSALTVSNGVLTPAFSDEVGDYSLEVSPATAFLVACPAAADNGSTIRIDGVLVPSGTPSPAISLMPGVRELTVKVTSASGVVSKTYTLRVRRLEGASANGDLAELAVTAGTLNPDFTPAGSRYAIDVAADVNSLTVLARPSGCGAAVTINGEPVTAGFFSRPIALSTGRTMISLVVRAEDGTERRSELAVTRLGVDVVLAGMEQSGGETRGYYLLNGQLRALDVPPGEITSVHRRGPDVYVAGSAAEGTGTVPCYWKNGVLNRLPMPFAAEYAQAVSVRVEGERIVAAGYGVTGGSRATSVYWDSGQARVLGEEGDQAFSVNTVQGSVAIAGYSFRGDDSRAWLWRDGVMSAPPADFEPSRTDSCFNMANGAAYIAGYTQSPTGSNRAAYTVDGMLTSIGEDQSLGTALCVDQGVVYVCGSVIIEGRMRACYWKNGVITVLSDRESSAVYIYARGDQVFVGGYYRAGSATVACLWRDGVRMDVRPFDYRLVQPLFMVSDRL